MVRLSRSTTFGYRRTVIAELPNVRQTLETVKLPHRVALAVLVVPITGIGLLAGCAPSDAGTVAKASAATPGLAGLACRDLASASKDLSSHYASQWVDALQKAEPLAAAAAHRDPRWQKLASAITSMEAQPIPGSSLPPKAATPAELAAYWKVYTPLISDCAPAGVTLPRTP